MNKNGLVYTIIFSFVATFILVAPLTLANEATKDIVTKNKQVASAAAILRALGQPVDKNDTTKLLADYDALTKYTMDAAGAVRTVDKAQLDAAAAAKQPISPLFYKADAAGQVRYAGTFTGPALWGNITLAVGFNQDVTRIAGITVIAQVETPGLGGRIEEPWFIGQFAEQIVPPGGVLAFLPGSGKGDANKDNNSVEAITGATLTTNGIRDIVANASVQIKKVVGGIQ